MIVVKIVSFTMHYGFTMERISIMNKTAVWTDTAFSKKLDKLNKLDTNSNFEDK